MMEDRMVTVQAAEGPLEQKGLIIWIKSHKKQLLLAGISVTCLLTSILCLRNKEAINELWSLLKEEVEKGPRYSTKWFENASLGELYSEREIVQKDYMNSELDIAYRDTCKNLLDKFDSFIGKKKWQGKDYSFPVYSENGPYLLSKG